MNEANHNMDIVSQVFIVPKTDSGGSLSEISKRWHLQGPEIEKFNGQCNISIIFQVMESAECISDVRFTLNSKLSHHRRGRGQNVYGISSEYRYIGFEDH